MLTQEQQDIIESIAWDQQQIKLDFLVNRLHQLLTTGQAQEVEELTAEIMVSYGSSCIQGMLKKTS